MPGPDSGSPSWQARLSTPGSPVCAPAWLALREGADAAARATELVDPVNVHLDGRPDPAVIRDLGCGTGSMGRWLAGRLRGPQVWILHDRDPGLLALAADDLPDAAADGASVTGQARQGDITALDAAQLAGTSLVTASALLDILTADEVDRIAAACVGASCMALLTLTVTGRVDITPSDPLDAAFEAAFNAHQRRSAGGRRLLGPDAGAVAVDAFTRRGAAVSSRPSPWRLGADQAELAEEWLRGWIDAACDQQPDLAAPAGPYLRRRLDACAAGELRVAVGHMDVLALPQSK
jgi:hypothetical protein